MHWGTSVGLLFAPSWQGPWTPMTNNTDDLLDGGRALFAHPVEDPFAWRSDDGQFHILTHAFRMGMLNRTVGVGDGCVSLWFAGFLCVVACAALHCARA